LFTQRSPWWFLKSRAAALAVACTVIVAGVASGSLAYLVSSSQTISNVFNPTFIRVDVTETPTADGDTDPNTNAYSMLPGAVIDKDPLVTLKAGSEASWVFVQLQKSTNFDSFMTYALAPGWTSLTGVEGVYWLKAPKSDQPQQFGVLLNDEVLVRPEVTEAMLNAMAQRPTLTVTAFAVQQEGIADAAAAWAVATN